MLKARLLESLYAELPCNRRQVSRSWSSFTGSNGRAGLAWNIRVGYPFPDCGKGFDAWADANSDLLDDAFNDLCEMALDDALTTIREQFPKDSLEFEQAGRSGGWLVLTSWTTMVGDFSHTFGYPVDALVQNMSRSTLVKFRRVIRAINAEFSQERLDATREWIADWYSQLYDESLDDHAVELEAERPDMYS